MSREPSAVLRLSRIVTTWFYDLLAGREDVSVRAAKHDQLKETVSGLRDALATHSRTIDELTSTVESLGKRNSILQAEYKALQSELEQRKSEHGQALLLRLFTRARSALVQLPTLKHAVQNGAALSATDVLDIASQLMVAFNDIGFTPIGEPGQVVNFDPAQHLIAESLGNSNTQEMRVKVRYVGYALDGHVISKAEVTLLDSDGN
jgi:molecular chaperone GrpE (heat shock protein)